MDRAKQQRRAWFTRTINPMLYTTNLNFLIQRSISTQNHFTQKSSVASRSIRSKFINELMERIYDIIHRHTKPDLINDFKSTSRLDVDDLFTNTEQQSIHRRILKDIASLKIHYWNHMT